MAGDPAVVPRSRCWVGEASVPGSSCWVAGDGLALCVSVWTDVVMLWVAVLLEMVHLTV